MFLQAFYSSFNIELIFSISTVHTSLTHNEFQLQGEVYAFLKSQKDK